MTLRLIPAADAVNYRREITDMMEEWLATGEKIVPYAIRRHDVHDFAAYCQSLEQHSSTDDKVPDSTFFTFVVGRDMRHPLHWLFSTVAMGLV